MRKNIILLLITPILSIAVYKAQSYVQQHSIIDLTEDTFGNTETYEATPIAYKKKEEGTQHLFLWSYDSTVLCGHSNVSDTAPQSRALYYSMNIEKLKPTDTVLVVVEGDTVYSNVDL
jgi:hypothetical protein